MMHDARQSYSPIVPKKPPSRTRPRNEKGRIVKQNDHLMGCTRYLVRARHDRMKTRPSQENQRPRPRYVDLGRSDLAWMA